MAYHRKKQNTSEASLLITRREAGELLNLSAATVARYEKMGAIKRVRLNPNSMTSTALYRRSDIIALVEGGVTAEAETEDA